MQLRSEVQLASMMKAMTDVVIPAIDTKNDLALQQAQLIVGMLKLMAHQLPVQFRFDRDELRRLIEYSGELSRLQTTDPETSAEIERMKGAITSAVTVLEHCTVDPAELIVEIRKMREIMSTLVSVASKSKDKAAFGAVEKAVLALSKEQLLRDRSLLAVQGWEPDPTVIPPIEVLLNTDGSPA